MRVALSKTSLSQKKAKNYLLQITNWRLKMKILTTAVILMMISGTALADELNYNEDSFQSHEHFTANQPSVGSADIDYVNSSFQLNQSYAQTGSKTEIGTAEIDYVNDSFQDSY